MAPTSGKAWRQAREEGYEIKFPSGLVANIRPIDVDFIVRVGRIPDVLAGMIADLIDGKKAEKVVPSITRVEERRDWLDFLGELCKYAFVSPRIVDSPQADDEISIDDLSYQDKFVVYQFFAQPAEVLRRFRDAQAKLVSPVVSAKDDGPPPQPDVENKALGK